MDWLNVFNFAVDLVSLIGWGCIGFYGAKDFCKKAFGK